MSLVDEGLLGDVHKRLGELVAVLDIVAAAAPHPVLVEILGAFAIAASTAAQVTVATGASDRL